VPSDNRLGGDGIGEGEVEARSSSDDDVGIGQRASQSSKGGGRSKQRKAPIKEIGNDDHRKRQPGRGSKQVTWDVNSRHDTATARDKRTKPFCDRDNH